MTQLLALFLASLLIALGIVTMIGLRRLATAAAIFALSIPLAIVLFVVAVIYRFHGL
jgi:hypothetical protein